MTTTQPGTGPTLSVNLQNYAVDNPGSWRFLIERAEAADAAGIDRLVV